MINEFVFQLSVRGKNKKEKLEDFFKNMVKSADGVIVSGVKVNIAEHIKILKCINIVVLLLMKQRFTKKGIF